MQFKTFNLITVYLFKNFYFKKGNENARGDLSPADKSSVLLKNVYTGNISIRLCQLDLLLPPPFFFLRSKGNE